MIAVYHCPVCGWAGISVPTPTFAPAHHPWLGSALHRRHTCPDCQAWLASSPLSEVERGGVLG